MPWIRVNELAVPIVHYTVDTSVQTHTISLGDRTAGDIVDINVQFPENFVRDSFYYSPRDLTGLAIEHFSVNQDNDIVTIRIRVIDSSVNIDEIRMGFANANENIGEAPTQLFNIVTV